MTLTNLSIFQSRTVYHHLTVHEYELDYAKKKLQLLMESAAYAVIQEVSWLAKRPRVGEEKRWRNVGATLWGAATALSLSLSLTLFSPDCHFSALFPEVKSGTVCTVCTPQLCATPRYISSIPSDHSGPETEQNAVRFIVFQTNNEIE